ncbi:MAG: hypothetical protein JWR61_3030 [Ferruginibacter sp.]|nr:hypothetical protein [Ferruginibacter sp.]
MVVAKAIVVFLVFIFYSNNYDHSSNNHLPLFYLFKNLQILPAVSARRFARRQVV